MDSDSSTNKPGLIINNITLTRYHEPVDTMTVAGKDSLAVERRVGTDSMVTEKKADSIQSVDIRKNVPVRMNPREMKENNAADHSHPRSSSENQAQKLIIFCGYETFCLSLSLCFGRWLLF